MDLMSVIIRRQLTTQVCGVFYFSYKQSRRSVVQVRRRSDKRAQVSFFEITYNCKIAIVEIFTERNILALN